MLELSISQAQAQFTKLLNKTAIIVDKKSNIKKAVMIPYEEYCLLMQRASGNGDQKKGVFDRFVGTLDSEFQTDDIKYHRIVD